MNRMTIRDVMKQVTTLDIESNQTKVYLDMNGLTIQNTYPNTTWTVESMKNDFVFRFYDLIQQI